MTIQSILFYLIHLVCLSLGSLADNPDNNPDGDLDDFQVPGPNNPDNNPQDGLDNPQNM